MSDPTVRRTASVFRVAWPCNLERRIARCCLALCIGMIFIVSVTFNSNFFNPRETSDNCTTRFTVPVECFNVKSVEIIRERFPDYLYGYNSSKIPCYFDYVKPNSSFRKGVNDDFQPVGVESSYVYSAYLDDRPSPDVEPKALPVVRIFTTLPRNSIGRVTRDWRCVLWYEGGDQPLVVPVAGITDLDILDTYRSILPTMVLCSIPTSSASAPLTAVSLVSGICHRPQNYLRVKDLSKRRRNFETLSLKSSSNHTRVSNFTICIPPLFGSYMTPVELIEFIELNRLLGAEKFVFYLESPSEELFSCLRYYTSVGLVELTNWTYPPFRYDEMHYHGQIVAQNECLFRVMYRTRYLVNQDLDEFIIPTRTTNWREMLDDIHKNMRAEDVDKIASYNFRNLFFPMNSARDSSIKDPFKVGGYELKTLSKTNCLQEPNEWRHRSKVMGRPERLLLWHVHEILDTSLVRVEDENAMVEEKHGLVFHYRDVDSDHLNKVNRRIWIYKEQLFERVTTRVGSSGFRTQRPDLLQFLNSSTVNLS